MAIRKAVVLLSGGQDSTTCYYWALGKYDEVYPLAFDYGQRHKEELHAAARIVDLAKSQNAADTVVGQGVVAHHLKILDLNVLGDLGSSALTNMKRGVNESGLQDRVNGESVSLPATFVPGRNALFLTTAAAYAAKYGAHDVITGVCETDYSGYPDCRGEFIQAMQHAVNLAMPASLRPISIVTPLMSLTKAETVQMAVGLPGCMEALARSVTCYMGFSPGCGTCAACRLRSRGFLEAGVVDPAVALAAG